jgi:large subunit ribosomal protein L9
MKVILLEDVKALGKKGEMVNINDGYARNFILKKNLGVEATTKSLNELKAQKANEEKRQKEILDEAQTFSNEINKKSVEVKMKSGEGGKTFGSISTKEIAKAAKEQLGYEIDKKKMQLAEPIKNLGVYQVSIKVHPEVTAQLKVKVTEL